MTSPGLDLWSLHPPGPQYRFRSGAHQDVHGIFVHLETREGHIYHRRKDDVKKEGHKHESSTETLLHGAPVPALTAIDPYSCPHAIVTLVNKRNNLQQHA